MEGLYGAYCRIRRTTRSTLIRAMGALFLRNRRQEMTAVADFFRTYPGFRSMRACSAQTGMNIWLCRMIKGYLYETRRLGLYHFEANTPPQKYMREAIVRKFPHVHQGSFILEVGPGEHPLFTPQEYANWYAVDKYWEDGRIKFKGLEWAKDKYPSGRVFSGDFDNLEDVFRPKALVGAFDLVVASHSYEHVFRPIESLKQAHRMLKPGGAICLFVPDGFTDDVNTKDPTHTLYVVPGMMEEFFHYSGGWREIAIEAFRPNADLIVTAVKE